MQIRSHLFGETSGVVAERKTRVLLYDFTSTFHMLLQFVSKWQHPSVQTECRVCKSFSQSHSAEHGAEQPKQSLLLEKAQWQTYRQWD